LGRGARHDQKTRFQRSRVYAVPGAAVKGNRLGSNSHRNNHRSGYVNFYPRRSRRRRGLRDRFALPPAKGGSRAQQTTISIRAGFQNAWPKPTSRGRPRDRCGLASLIAIERSSNMRTVIRIRRGTTRLKIRWSMRYPPSFAARTPPSAKTALLKRLNEILALMRLAEVDS